ncbi:hypothetical protein Syun_019077 [Stephania yunnanensis]|uniref:Uncharacterized protein n=1 Tax=Stephania yunnanensis TaxID=152371 RepID=A0AAP0IU41_9MAGN
MEDEGTMMRRRPCPEEMICNDAREDERDETKQRLSLCFVSFWCGEGFDRFRISEQWNREMCG